MDNHLYLCKYSSDEIIIAIGSLKGKRRVRLTDEAALQLAYKLMSLARGGETLGMEKQNVQ